MSGATGTLGGPTQFGAVDVPSKPPAYQSIDQFKGFDSTPLQQSLDRQIQQGGVQQKSNAISQASRLGAGRSAGTANNLNTIQAQTENRIADTDANLDEKSYEERINEQNAANQYALGQYQAQLSAANEENKNYLAEKAMRQSSVSNLPFGNMIAPFM